MTKLLSIGLLLIPILAGAQWEVGDRLILTGDSASERAVDGVAAATDAGDGIPAGLAQQQAIIYEEIPGGTQLSLSLEPAPLAYTNGMLVSFALTTSNDSAAQLNVNGLGPVALQNHC